MRLRLPNGNDQAEMLFFDRTERDLPTTAIAKESRNMDPKAARVTLLVKPPFSMIVYNFGSAPAHSSPQAHPRGHQPGPRAQDPAGDRPRPDPRSSRGGATTGPNPCAPDSAAQPHIASARDSGTDSVRSGRGRDRADERAGTAADDPNRLVARTALACLLAACDAQLARFACRHRLKEVAILSK